MSCCCRCCFIPIHLSYVTCEQLNSNWSSLDIQACVSVRSNAASIPTQIASRHFFAFAYKILIKKRIFLYPWARDHSEHNLFFSASEDENGNASTTISIVQRTNSIHSKVMLTCFFAMSQHSSFFITALFFFGAPVSRSAHFECELSWIAYAYSKEIHYMRDDKRNKKRANGLSPFGLVFPSFLFPFRGRSIFVCARKKLGQWFMCKQEKVICHSI